MIIRKYQKTDCEEIWKLFYNTVHKINSKDYSAEQIEAWVNKDIDLEKWNISFEEHYTVVVIENDVIVGFGDIDEDTGYLDRLYVHAYYQGQGIATVVCDYLEKRASGKITTHSSITAKPFFEKRGYKVIKEQRVERKGIFLTNFVMEKL